MSKNKPKYVNEITQISVMSRVKQNDLALRLISVKWLICTSNRLRTSQNDKKKIIIKTCLFVCFVLFCFVFLLFLFVCLFVCFFVFGTRSSVILNGSQDYSNWYEAEK